MAKKMRCGVSIKWFNLQLDGRKGEITHGHRSAIPCPSLGFSTFFLCSIPACSPPRLLIASRASNLALHNATPAVAGKPLLFSQPAGQVCDLGCMHVLLSPWNTDQPINCSLNLTLDTVGLMTQKAKQPKLLGIPILSED